MRGSGATRVAAWLGVCAWDGGARFSGVWAQALVCDRVSRRPRRRTITHPGRQADELVLGAGLGGATDLAHGVVEPHRVERREHLGARQDSALAGHVDHDRFC